MSIQLLDVERLLLDREGVVGLLLGLVAVEERGRERDRLEAVLHRRENVGEILELAVERPLAGGLHIVGVAIGDVGNGAGVERGTDFAFMSWTAYCESSTLVPVLPRISDRGIERSSSDL